MSMIDEPGRRIAMVNGTQGDYLILNSPLSSSENELKICQSLIFGTLTQITP